MTWTLTLISTPGNSVYLNTLEDGLPKIVGLDWTTGKKVAEIELPRSFKFNCAGGFIFPLRDGNLFVGGMFGPFWCVKHRETRTETDNSCLYQRTP